MTFDPKARPDLHKRFLQVCARETVHHAAHLAAVRKLDLRRPLDPDAHNWILPVRRRDDSQP